MKETILLTEASDARGAIRMPHKESFPVRVVKGIVLPGAGPIVSYDDKYRFRYLSEEAITLPDVQAERLEKFVAAVVVKQELDFWNCLTFAAYMHRGNEEAPLRDYDMPNRIDVDSTNDVQPDALCPGDSYLVRRNDPTKNLHAIMGVNDPTEHLAVWGDRQPLAFAANKDMLNVYNGASPLVQVIGSFTLR